MSEMMKFLKAAEEAFTEEAFSRRNIHRNIQNYVVGYQHFQYRAHMFEMHKHVSVQYLV